ncbi:hypothetical protein [Enterobacter cloacae]|uniref:hypothetical protein n=1 Tax=Enterobacter cloacae TaxID=550 RepID=UPI00338D8EF7
MSTITKERAELKAFITGFLSDPAHDSQSANGLTANVFRIALASLEAEPVGEVSEQRDGLVMDGTVDLGGASTHRIIKGASKMKRLPLGTKFYTAPPAPVSVPDAMEMDDDFDSAFEHGKAVGWNACRAAMLQGADGSSPVIQDAYDIEAFGVFSASEGEDGLLLQIENFRLGTENCPQIGKGNMVPKFALQAIINRLQEHCDSMGNETLVNILSAPAAPQQDVK